MTDSPAPAGSGGDQGPEDLRSDTTKKKSAGRVGDCLCSSPERESVIHCVRAESVLILITECGWPVWCAGGRPTALLIIIRNVILCTQSLVTTLTLRSAAAGISPWARAQHSRLVTSSDSDLSLLQILTREGSLQLDPGAAAWPDSAATGERDWGRVATGRCGQVLTLGPQLCRITLQSLHRSQEHRHHHYGDMEHHYPGPHISGHPRHYPPPQC